MDSYLYIVDYPYILQDQIFHCNALYSINFVCTVFFEIC